MLEKKAATEKFAIIGIDALDPRLMKKYVDKGLMPNTKKFIENGACREDLVLLGANPTITPPQWTTLSTGAYPMTHGVTGFYRQSKTDLDVMQYNLDSRRCTAEQLWDVCAEAGKKTLVFHWPGCSWPPTRKDLYVIDGSNPGSACMSTNQVEDNFIFYANETINNLKFVPKAGKNVSMCVIDDLQVEQNEGYDFAAAMSGGDIRNIMIDSTISQQGGSGLLVDTVISPLRKATNWTTPQADNAMEFTLLFSGGFVYRPCLLVKNSVGQFDKALLFKKKTDTQPYAELPLGKYIRSVKDIAYKDDIKYDVIRSMCLLNVDQDEQGIKIRIYVSAAMNLTNDAVFYPTSLFKELGENVSYPPPTVNIFNMDKDIFLKCMIEGWYEVADWESGCINYMIKEKNIECVFSHFHANDLLKHEFLRYLNGKYDNIYPLEVYDTFLEAVAKLTDYYIGKYLYLLDEGWTVVITSDHGQVCSKHEPVGLGDVQGVNVTVMEELGYTVVKRDENGNRLREIDWEKTRAIAIRENDIYINLKGRWKTGIVDPEDQYELEEQIMTDLYGYRHNKTGHRVVALALRNRDAALLGLGGPESGDIIYFNAEGYNYDHGDSLSTAYGEKCTSSSPLFIISGKGIKLGYTNRVIRQVDVAPTLAVLAGLRMPAQCEGAPVYQILKTEY